MRIYVAAAFSEREHAKACMDEFRAAGHIITHDWTGESSAGKTGDVLTKYLRKCAMDDVNGVTTCDVFVMLASDKGRGSHTEFGIAIALNKPIFVLDGKSTINIFFHLPSVVLCEDIKDVRWWLAEMERKASETREHARSARSGKG